MKEEDGVVGRGRELHRPADPHVAWVVDDVLEHGAEPVTGATAPHVVPGRRVVGVCFTAPRIWALVGSRPSRPSARRRAGSRTPSLLTFKRQSPASEAKGPSATWSFPPWPLPPRKSGCQSG